MANPNYFAVIPANVRYSKDLNSRQKLLYAEISALSQKEGYAFASNKYWSELFGVAVETISRDVKALSDFGFVRCEIDKAGGNQRKIYLLISGSQDLLTNKSIAIDRMIKTPIDQAVKTPIDPTIKHNNIKINKTSFNNKNEQEIGAHEKKEEKNLELGEATSIHSEKMKVLAYLNKKTNAPIQPGGGRPGQYIEQLFNQGYTKEQMIKVIDRKAELFQAGEIPALYVAAHVIFKPENFTTEIFMLDNPEKKNGKIEKDAMGRIVIDNDRKKWEKIKEQVKSGNF